MDDWNIGDEASDGGIDRKYYRELLKKFDHVVCESISVSQFVSGRFEMPAVGYSTHIFSRMCAHAQALICAAPLSRWVRREFEMWDIAAVAPHARSLLEGYLLFRYLADAPSDLDTQRAYVQVMNLYDCLKRIKIISYVLTEDAIKQFELDANEIKGRLEEIRFFSSLDNKIKRDIFNGKYMMITPQRDLISSIGIDEKEFDFFWNYFSQYTHVLSFSFYRMEPEGRGTGIENAFDKGAICTALRFCTDIMASALERITEIFPDAKVVRNGVNSKFSPGPSRNVPRHIKKMKRNMS
ncbi:DUF5677 domain-containing protein [Nitrospirillum amazonense]|uniref:DUF5677 domain-containing protein n=1 Tax=Nitrospirillum amazonense TaxID=28077 RepID=UPI002DD4395E|nr:DUF5677 domain-containing protein [Nitrospirillum amazonense]MEC4591262.1 DUF5677 domain-containing protein [Nitrospirillum amazonense]